MARPRPASATPTRANDTSVGDLDGDGQYEIVLKWDPTNAKDNSQSGYTGNIYLDAYKLNGTRLWRDRPRPQHPLRRALHAVPGVRLRRRRPRRGGGEDRGRHPLGHRPGDRQRQRRPPQLVGLHPGRAGVPLGVPRQRRRGAGDRGLRAGTRERRRVGATTTATASTGSSPARPMWTVRGRASSWPAATTRVPWSSAWDFRNGALTRRWTFDSNSSTNGSAWTGKGNHQLSVADVDGDGRDEILYGSMAIDDNGYGLWQNNTHHGDAYHVGDLIPSRAGLEVFKPSESGGDPAHWMGDARTGQIIWSAPSCGCDNGRGVAADIWSGSPGAEAWSSAVGGLRSGANGSTGRRAQTGFHQLRDLVGRRRAARAAGRHAHRQVRHGRRHPPADRFRCGVEQRHEGHPRAVGRHPRRLARGGDLADLGQPGAARSTRRPTRRASAVRR